MENEYLTYEQVAHILGIKTNTLYSMVATKRIPHVRLGPRLVRFSRVELEQWIAANRVSAEEK